MLLLISDSKIWNLESGTEAYKCANPRVEKLSHKKIIKINALPISIQKYLNIAQTLKSTIPIKLIQLCEKERGKDGTHEWCDEFLKVGGWTGEELAYKVLLTSNQRQQPWNWLVMMENAGDWRHTSSKRKL